MGLKFWCESKTCDFMTFYIMILRSFICDSSLFSTLLFLLLLLLLLISLLLLLLLLLLLSIYLPFTKKLHRFRQKKKLIEVNQKWKNHISI